MILDDKCKTKPDIKYPCEWGFKLIGKDKAALDAAIFDIMAERDYTCTEGNVSKKGKFLTLNAKCEVCSEEERNEIFKAFSEHDAVKMVI